MRSDCTAVAFSCSIASRHEVAPVEYIVGPSVRPIAACHPAQSPVLIMEYGPSTLEADASSISVSETDKNLVNHM